MKMKPLFKKAAPAGLAFSIVFFAGHAVAQETNLNSADIAVQVDGRGLTFDQAPRMLDGRVMVPLRGVFESMGADVVYDAATKSIKATGENDRVIELALGNKEALVDGKKMYLDVPARAFEGRTMVPLRFVSESLGANVRWLSATRTVAIESPQEVAQLAPAPVKPEAAITNVAHNAHHTLGNNDTLTVTMTGTPGGTANFDLLGVADDVPMNEVAPGNYQGELRVKPGMDLNNGSIVVQLTMDGKTVQRQSSDTLSINSHGTAGANMLVTPADGGMVDTETPLITANFDSQVRPETIKMTIDGRDVSAWANKTGDAVTYTPDPRLTRGGHTVAVQAVDNQGNTVAQQWDFQVSGLTGDGQRPALTVTNMASGKKVGETFDIEGRTSPNSKVQMTAFRKGVANPQPIKITGIADDGGNFDIEMDTSALPEKSSFKVEVLAIDDEGDVSDPVVLDLLRY